MTAPLNLGTDAQGKIDYTLEFPLSRKYNNSFAAGTESWIVLEADDKKAIFFPTPGANYTVGWETIPAFPATPGAPMVGNAIDVVQNPAALQLNNWPIGTADERRLYISSELAQTMTILVYK